MHIDPKYDKIPLEPFTALHFNASSVLASTYQSNALMFRAALPQVGQMFDILASQYSAECYTLMGEAKAQYVEQRGPMARRIAELVEIEELIGNRTRADQLRHMQERLLPLKDSEPGVDPAEHLLFLCRPFFTLILPKAFNLPFVREDPDTGRYVMQDDLYSEINVNLLDEDGVLPLVPGPAQVLKRKGNGWEVHMRIGTEQSSLIAFSFTVNRNYVQLGMTRIYDALEKVEYSVQGIWDYILPHNVMFDLLKLMKEAGYEELPGWKPNEWSDAWQTLQSLEPLPDYLADGKNYSYLSWSEKYVETLIPPSDPNRKPVHTTRATLSLRDRVSGYSGKMPEVIVYDRRLPQFTFDNGENWTQINKATLPAVYRLLSQLRSTTLAYAKTAHEDRQKYGS